MFIFSTIKQIKPEKIRFRQKYLSYAWGKIIWKFRRGGGQIEIKFVDENEEICKTSYQWNVLFIKYFGPWLYSVRRKSS